MALQVFVNSVQRAIQLDSLDINQVGNARETAECIVRSMDGSYSPALSDEVVYVEDGSIILGGYVSHAEVMGPASSAGRSVRGVHPAINTNIVVGDYNSLLERRVFNGTLAAGTMKSQLTTLAALLATYGVTLHASQVDGPTVPELVVEDEYVISVINAIMKATSEAGETYICRIDETKTLRAYQPTTVAAPFDLVGAAGLAKVLGDIVVEKNKETYANIIIARGIKKTDPNRVETFTGDGVTSTFTLNWTLLQAYGLIHVYESDGVTPAGGETFAIVGTDTATQWEHNPTTNQMTRVIGPTEAGKIYKLTFSGEFAPRVTVSDPTEIAAEKEWEKVIKVDNVESEAALQAIAEAELARSIYDGATVRYFTRDGVGLRPGQSQVVTVSERGVDLTSVITEINIRADRKRAAFATPARLLREVEAVIDLSRTNLDRNWVGTYHVWFGDKTGLGGSAAATVPNSVTGALGGPDPPHESVQTNQHGAFDGDEGFTFTKNNTTVKVGAAHSTAGFVGILNGSGHTVL